MKRFLISMMALGLIAGSVATAQTSHAGRTRMERTVEGSYVAQFVPSDVYCTRNSGRCVNIEPRKGEAFFTAKAVDAHGQPVLVTAFGPKTGQGAQRLFYGSFCGETDEPIAFIPGFEVLLRVEGPGGDLYSLGTDCPMFGTSGTISVTLSNLP